MEIAESQMSIEEFRGDDEEEDHEEPREGVRGKVNPDGTIDVDDPNQVTLDDTDGPVIPENKDDLPF